jgi:DNA-directed RNA polymerase specialized sigma subunit
MRVLPGIQHPILDNIQIHNRREEKRAELSHEFQLKLDEYYRVKLKDYYEAKFNLEKYNLAKDIEEINADYLKGMTFHYVSNMKEVLRLALLNEKVKNPIKISVPKKEKMSSVVN